MAFERLQVILEMITGNYKKEAREAATSTSKIGEAAATSGSKVGGMAGAIGKAGTLIKAALAGAAVAAIGDVIGNLDELGQKMEATERMANTVFGAMVDDARAWADANNEAFGIGENAMLGLISKTQDLLVPMGFLRDEAFELSKGILNTANALSEWEGGTISAEDAQLRLAKALLGEREGLVELGIKITDQEVKARLVARGMDRLTGSARQQAIAQVTLELVTEKSTDALAAYEDRAGSAVAAQKELEASTADTAETWADIFRPAIDDAKAVVGDFAAIAGFASEKLRDVRGEAEDTARVMGDPGFLNFVFPGLEDLLLDVQRLADHARDAGGGVGEMSGELFELPRAIDPAIVKNAELGDSLVTLRPKIKSVNDAYMGLTNTLLASTDPVFAAVSAMQRLAEVQKDPEASSLDLAEAVIQAQSALSDLAGGNVEQAIGIIADALGTTNDAARDLLESAGLLKDLDDIVINVLLKYDSEGTPLPPAGVKLAPGVVAAINAAFPSSQTRFGGAFDMGGVVRARRGEPVLAIVHGGETILPTHKMALPTFDSGGIVGGISHSLIRQGGLPAGWNRPNVHMTFTSPINDLRTDMMYATVMATVTTMVEAVA